MPTAVDFLLEQNLSSQWRGFLRALAEEFESQLSPDELRHLMFRVGCRYAGEHALAPCESTADLEHALNLHWASVRWGYVELSDQGSHLRIVHYGAPITAFGNGALAWMPAFLQGSYQTWLDAMGASQLTVVQSGSEDDGFAVEFLLTSDTV
ncbi:cellulose biosynthesis protein BcsD [Burkholderia gladioli]|uniref:cellulose biosynthesis protein BcsD n=1 Tax=Burkholderia gladioli TaxID=28095 RepID=UPI001641B074|nr:cellulose biosynthesis protein BcsD [Burkholderia gladioli]